MPLHRTSRGRRADGRNDDVLGPTATAFLQGFYPPSLLITQEMLTNGTVQGNPLNGYQYVPLNGIPPDAPSTIWLRGDQFCPALTKSSLVYYQSSKFVTQQAQLQPFYDRFTPLLQGIFPESAIGFQNAYLIFDYFNFGYMHNLTIYKGLSSADLFQLRTLADEQQLDLVYNSTVPAVSIGGSSLAGAILIQLSETVTQSNPALRITYYAAPHSVMQAFFGVSGLLQAHINFWGLPAYAGTMVFELRRPVGDPTYDHTFVRFSMRNGSDPSTPQIVYPLFGRTDIESDMPWAQFEAEMALVGITTAEDWCHACGTSDLTFCAAYTQGVGRTGLPENQGPKKVSKVAAGGIGAGVTLAVIALAEGAAGMWYFRRRRGWRRGRGARVTDDAASDIKLVVR
jgi:prostatic acid phosphatase